MNSLIELKKKDLHKTSQIGVEGIVENKEKTVLYQRAKFEPPRWFSSGAIGL